MEGGKRLEGRGKSGKDWRWEGENENKIHSLRQFEVKFLLLVVRGFCESFVFVKGNGKKEVGRKRIKQKKDKEED